jgi:uncharacterized membrane protein
VIRHTGDFATRGIALCEVWPAARLTPEVADGFRAAYAVGARRTSERDPLLGMDLLAEIGVRALWYKWPQYSGELPGFHRQSACPVSCP